MAQGRYNVFIMKRCIIITSYIHGHIHDLVDLQPEDFILCADGGAKLALEEGLVPSLVIGDFDSNQGFAVADLPPTIPVQVHPVQKDYTDTGLCLAYAVENGFQDILVLGGFGGREDHTMANLQNLFHYHRPGIRLTMRDAQNMALPVVNQSLSLPCAKGWRLSVFSHSAQSLGVTLRGVLYPLEGGTLSSNFPLGVGNSALADEVFIEVKEGALLVMLSRDDADSKTKDPVEEALSCYSAGDVL